MFALDKAIRCSITGCGTEMNKGALHRLIEKQALHNL